MAVIWGLDLREMQWGKFKGSYMFNQTYHLRRTKMIVYQCAMILLVVSESVGTAALSDYVDQQDGIQTRFGRQAHVDNNDIVGVFSYNIFVGIAVATIFGSGFFFDLFWPERKETPSVRLAWKICSVIMCFMTLADAIAVTVIVARDRATIPTVTAALEAFYFRSNGPPTPIYRENADCVASCVLLWLGMIATWASTYIMHTSIRHDDEFGPFSAHYKGETKNFKDEETSIDAKSHELKPLDTSAGINNTHGTPPETSTHTESVNRGAVTPESAGNTDTRATTGASAAAMGSTSNGMRNEEL